MKVVAATKNKGKIREISKILSSLGIDVVSLDDMGIDVDIEETGETFVENARIKAEGISLLTNEVVLADDSGLSVDYLGGAPGVYSARYAGEGASDKDRIDKLLGELSNVTDRDAHFECAIVLKFPSGEEITAVGKAHGRILLEATGDGGFGYDSVFFSKELGKSFGEATEDEKNKVSHRAKALFEIARILETKITEDK